MNDERGTLKRKGVVSWWKGLSKAAKGITIGCSSLGLATAIVVPTVIVATSSKPKVDQATPIELNFVSSATEGEAYTYKTDNNIKANTKFKATINYIDTRSILFIEFTSLDFKTPYNVGKNDSSQPINITSILDSKNYDIIDASITSDDYIFFNSSYFEKLIINFTVTVDINNLFIIAGEPV